MTASRPHSPRCQVCNHPQRAEIDVDLIHGMSAAKIVAKYGGLSGGPTVWNHKIRHMLQDIAASPDLVPLTNAIQLRELLQELVNSSLRILREADAAGDKRLALKASDTVAARVDTLCRLLVAGYASARERALLPELDGQTLCTLEQVDREIERLKSLMEIEQGEVIDVDPLLTSER